MSLDTSERHVPHVVYNKQVGCKKYLKVWNSVLMYCVLAFTMWSTLFTQDFGAFTHPDFHNNIT